MNTIWSENIQGIMTLYLSRKLRFDDRFQSQYQNLFRIDHRRTCRILEIGCGPGAMAGSLHRWYPNAEITAIDRDSRFIAFAKDHEPGILFVEADAAALPFPDDSFDVTISYAVQEHIEPAAFWGEQKRVLRTGGFCICISARRGVTLPAKCLAATEDEKHFWNSIPDGNETLKKYNVGKYWLNESELPLQMAEYGFRNVSTGYSLIELTPDNPGCSDEFAERIIEAERQSDLDAVWNARADDSDKIAAIINRKYNLRRRLYREGIPQWDTLISLSMTVRGEA